MSFADDAGKFFDLVDVRERFVRFDQVMVVPLAPAAQPSQHNASFAENYHCPKVSFASKGRVLGDPRNMRILGRAPA